MESGHAKRLEWTKRAVSDLIDAIDYIYLDSPRNAALVKNRVVQAVEVVADYPEVGSLGRVIRTRECPVPNTSLTVVYRVKPTVVQIVRVLHQRRRYP